MKTFIRSLSIALFFTTPNAWSTSTFDSIVVEGACTLSNGNASTVPYFDSGKNIVSSSVTPTELGYLSGVTSALQTQINAKASLASPALTGSPTAPTQAQSDGSTKIATTAYTDTAVSNATIPDATSLVKGKVQLAGDLGGTAASPTVPGLAGKEPSITSGTTAQYWRGDKTMQNLTATVTAYTPTTSSDWSWTSVPSTVLAALDSVANWIKNAASNLYAFADHHSKYVSKSAGSDTNNCGYFSPCKTIQVGVNTAISDGAAYYDQRVVHVAPAAGGTGSSYNENVTIAQQGINLVCDANQVATRACLISGTVTVDMTGVTGGTNYVAASNESHMSGFVMVVNSSGTTLNFIGSTFQRFIMTNCYVDQNGSGGAATISNTGLSGPTPSALIVYDTNLNNSNSTTPTVLLSSGARFWLYGTTSTIANGNASGPSVTQSGAASSFIANLVQLSGQYNLTSNTATATFNLSTISSGANPCIVTPSSANTGYALLAYFGCTSTATNSITGSGVVVGSPGNIRTSTSGDIIGTVTQTVFPGLPQGEVMVGAGATTGTNVLLSIFGGHIKVSQTTAPTATVSANAGTSASCTLTNGRDSSGIINLTEGSASWASGTQCTITFNKAYGVAPNCVAWPHNAAAAAHQVTQQFFSTTSTTTLLLATGAADSAATASQWSYKCEEP